MCKLGVISQERLKTEVKLLLSANRKLYTPRRLAQQRMTLSDLKWSFHGSSVPSVWERRAMRSDDALQRRLTLSPLKAEKPASPIVTNSRKTEIPACRSLIYTRKDELSA